ncbi:AEC family transporter [Agathobaculum sp. NTUH-O15-33]|uniref:AEC family transporter n=1 Tax=Agathobaculum sp. NTUH-O15-33 TaxID=3079302 RepID=UPI002958B797|nr:AEC family transporter [Agathobaculum sp. NTUH-O15-33]WNX84768.1 AEC family transporter [Agathobaculum sp. NTUH-O15-33]
MQQVFSQLLVLLLILGAGFVCGRIGLLTETFSAGLNTLVIQLTLPALILASMDVDFSWELLHNSLALIMIAAVCFAAVIAALEIWRKFSRLDPVKLGVYQYLILVGNCAFMGFPVIEAIYGGTGLLYAAMFVIPHNLLLYSYSITLFHRGAKAQWGKIFRNSGLIATAVGFLLFLCPFTLPYPVHHAIDWLGNMTVPLALLILGSRMSRTDLRTVVRPAGIWLSALTRLVLFPALMIPALVWLGLDKMLVSVPVILFATPVALTAASFAQQYGSDADLAGRGVVLSNLLAIITLPVVVAVLLAVLR